MWSFKFLKKFFIVVATFRNFCQSIEKMTKTIFSEFCFIWRKENELFVENYKKKYLETLIQPKLWKLE